MVIGGQEVIVGEIRSVPTQELHGQAFNSDTPSGQELAFIASYVEANDPGFMAPDGGGGPGEDAGASDAVSAASMAPHPILADTTARPTPA